MSRRELTPEGLLLKEVLELLKALKSLGVLDYTRISVDGIRTRSGVRARNFHMEGFSDLEIVVKGRVGYIELKSKTGVLSEAQIRFRDGRVKAGAKYVVARSVHDVLLFIIEEMEASITWTSLNTLAQKL